MDTIGKVFCGRYRRQTIESASTLFAKMVRKSGPGHDIKQKKDSTLENLNKNLSHKAINSLVRIQQIKNTSLNPEMIKSMVRLMCKRFNRDDDAYKNQLAEMFEKNNNINDKV